MVVRPWAGHRGLGDPVKDGQVHLLDRDEGSAGEERLANKANRAFYASLFVAARWPAGSGLEVIVARQLEVSVVKAKDVTAALEDN